MKRRKNRIFIGLIEIAGYFASLNDGFRQLGIDSCFFQYFENRYYDGGSRFMKICQLISTYRYNGNKFTRILFFPIDNSVKIFLFTWAVLKFDTFIFASNTTFFRYKELWLLKKMKKKIIYVFLGTESRPDYLSGNLINRYYIENGEVKNIKHCAESAANKSMVIKKIEKYADYCINHPPCALFHTRPYIKWLYVGFAFSTIKKILGTQPVSYCDSIKILHAPTNTETKGTYIFREVIERLKNEGHNIEYIEIIGQPNHKVLELLSQCDFVLDELYSDIPLGGLGTEAAFFKKPTISGGYYAEFIGADYDKDVIPPAVFCEPEKLEDSIRMLISNAELRKQIGQEAYEFVNANWDAKQVAGKYLKIINDEIPEEWFGDPYSLNYTLGYGQSKQQYKKVVSSILNECGESGFSLDDKPYLIKQIQEDVKTTF